MTAIDSVQSERSVQVATDAGSDPGVRSGTARAVLRSGEGRVGIAVASVVLGVVIVGALYTPYPPNEIGTGPASAGMSSDHWLGTDQLGRDVMSRFLVGGSQVLIVPLLAVSLAYLIGGTIGMFAALRGGTVDLVTSRVFDLMITFPPLLFVLVLVAGIGDSTAVIVLTVAALWLPRVGRLLRGATQSVVGSDYVLAARGRGERTWWILGREVLPNIAAPAIADFAQRVTFGVIFVATLNFLGLGADPPDAEWGLMVSESRAFIALNPWATFAPVVGIAGLSVALNLIADAISTHLAPDTRQQGKYL